MNKYRRIEIEKAAKSVRDECNIIDYGFQNIFESAEKIGFRVIRYPVGKDSFLGFAMIKEGEKIIFSNSSEVLSREIFSMAHEIGHHKLHLSDTDIALIKYNDFNNKDAFEIEANYFTACLLMPVDKVINFIRLELNDKEIDLWSGLDIARLQTAFNVSYQMAVIRLKALNLIDGNLYDKLILEKRERTATKFLSIISGNIDLCKSSEVKTIPAEFIEWVISNYNEKLIPIDSLEVALDYVDLKIEDSGLFSDECSSDNNEEEESFDDLFEGID